MKEIYYNELMTVNIDAVWAQREVEQDARNRANLINNMGFVEPVKAKQKQEDLKNEETNQSTKKAPV